jgi:hypothetical protein
MARARNIKPGLFRNEVLGAADPLYTLLFEGLWLLADRAGRLEDRPLRIRADVFPYRDVDIATMLSWLEEQGFILRYLANGLALIQIVQFAKHQNPHKNEPPSELGSGSEEIGSAPADSGFLIPDSGLQGGAASAQPPASKRKAKPGATELPADFGVSERVRDWAERGGYGQLDRHLEAFKSKARAKGYTYVSWDDAFMEAIREDWAKLRGSGQRGGPAPPPERTEPKGPDPALEKIKRDAERAAAPSLETLERIAKLRKGQTA